MNQELLNQITDLEESGRMTQELLNQICTELMDSAKLNLEKDGELTPVAFAVYGRTYPNEQYPQFTLGVAPLSWKDADDKYRVHEEFVKAAKAKDAKAVIFIHDARFRHTKPEEEELVRDYSPAEMLKRLNIKPGEISNDPTCTECLVLYGYAPGLAPVLTTAPYERDLPGSLTDKKAGRVDKIKWLPAEAMLSETAKQAGVTADQLQASLDNVGGAVIDIARLLDPEPTPAVSEAK